jgi:hypothetical protein
VNKSWVSGLTALTLALIASSASAEMMLWIKPTAASDPTTVLNNLTWDAGSTGAAPSITINTIPTTPQTITFTLYASVHGTNTTITDDSFAAATLNLLNSTVSGKTPLSGVPSLITLSSGIDSSGSCRGVLATTDLTGDSLQDIGGPKDTTAITGGDGPYIKPYISTGGFATGRVASTADSTWTDIPVGTFTYTYGQSAIASGSAAQLQTQPINFPGGRLQYFMAVWRQDGTNIADYSGYAGTGVTAGPAVVINVANQADDSVVVVKQNLPIGADGTDGKTGIAVDFGRVMKGATGSTLTQTVVLHNNGAQSAAAYNATATGSATATPDSPIAKGADGNLVVGLRTDTAGDFTSGSAVTIANTKITGSTDLTDTIAVKGTVVVPRTFQTSVTVAPPTGCANFLKGASISGLSVTVGSSTGFVTNPGLMNPDSSKVSPDSSGNYVGVRLPNGLTLTNDTPVVVSITVSPEGLTGEPAYGANSDNKLALSVTSSAANVGKAAVGSKNPDNTWNLGSELGASLAASASMAGLSSSVDANTANGTLATTATILAGTTTTAGTVMMSWRNRNPSELHAASLPTGAKFTPPGSAISAASASATPLLSLLATDSGASDPLDTMALAGATGSDSVIDPLVSASDFSLITGTDTTGNSSVSNLTSSAVSAAVRSGGVSTVPEPGTLGLIAAALAGLALWGLRRRNA